VGWQANLMKDIPFAALKLTMYEASLKAYRRLTHKDDMASLTAMEVAFLGVVSGTCQVERHLASS